MPRTTEFPRIERVFLLSIRRDVDEGSFVFPAKFQLTEFLKDKLEDAVDDKYYLSEKSIEGFMGHNERHEEKGTGFLFKPKDANRGQSATCLRANSAICATDNTIRYEDE